MITAFFHPCSLSPIFALSFYVSLSPLILSLYASLSCLCFTLISSGLCVVHHGGSHTCFWAEANIPWAWDGQGEREEGEEASKSGHFPLSSWPACPTPSDQERRGCPWATPRSRYPDTTTTTKDKLNFIGTKQMLLVCWYSFSLEFKSIENVVRST